MYFDAKNKAVYIPSCSQLKEGRHLFTHDVFYLFLECVNILSHNYLVIWINEYQNLFNVKFILYHKISCTFVCQGSQTANTSKFPCVIPDLYHIFNDRWKEFLFKITHIPLHYCPLSVDMTYHQHTFIE